MKQVTVKNDWEKLTYKAGERQITTKEPFSVLAVFPDGVQQVVRVIPKNFGTTCHDHGHSYSVETTSYHVMAEYHGVPIRIPLESLQIDLG